MPFRMKPDLPGADLVKTHIAAGLRERILRGELQPGEIISETHWGRQLGVAQASVREALNHLAGEGLVRKEPGRSARVTNLTQSEVIQAYELRSVMEGLAARLLAEQKADLGELERSIEEMERAALKGNLRGALEADLLFHLRLCELSGNVFLARQARQLLVPFFAFTAIRAAANSEAAPAWVETARDHQLILAGIRSGDPVFAEQSARHAIGKFVTVAHRVWAGEVPEPAGRGLRKMTQHQRKGG